MHNGELAKKYLVSPLTQKVCRKTRCDISVKQMLRTWVKTLWVWLISSKSVD